MRNAAHLHRTTDPETSRQAAELAASITDAHEDRILWTLEKAGRRADAAMTAEEIAEACGLSAHQVGRRVGRLILQGKVEVVGSKVLSTGRAGRTYRRTR